MSGEPRLSVAGLWSSYGGPDVLKGVSLCIGEGEVVTVVGPNGHGKSTLLRTISGLLKVEAGHVRLEGRDVTGWPADRIAATGVTHVPQGDLLFPEMTVYENLLMGAYTARDSHSIAARFEEVYALLPRLAERRNQLAVSLSGGERRMVGIGRGLMAGGKVMLIDEPSLGLAPLLMGQIYEVIRELRNRGTTILLVEENPARVVDLCDLIHLLDDGEFVWSGSPAELMQRDELLSAYLGG